MIQIFRKFFSSKLGIAFTLAFLGLIAIAFASADVSTVGSFDGLSNEQRVAAVGDRRITSSDLSMNVSSQVDQARAQNPTLTMETFVAQGGFDNVLDQMIRRTALAEFAEQMGLRAGNRLVDSEIVQLPGFTNLEGKFDSEAFRANLRQRGLNEDLIRTDLAMGLLARQMLVPITTGIEVPRGVAQRYATLLRERRQGRIAAIPAAAFAPEDDPSAEQLQAFYTENRADYIRPERRVLRYAILTGDAISNLPEPTEAQIARRYARDSEVYQESESRVVTQLVVPTEAAARTVVEEVRGGMSLEESARAKGLETVTLPPRDRPAIASAASRAVADAAFTAQSGALAEPARGNLGWYVQRIDRVSTQPGQTLAQASDTIREQLRREARERMLNETTSAIEDQLAEGRNLTEVAQAFGLEVETTRPLTAAGTVYGTTEQGPEDIAEVLQAAFEMDEAEPQLAESRAGERFIIFDVTRVIESATAPLAEIREEVTAQWRRRQGMRRAGEAAGEVLAALSDDTPLAQALQSLDTRLPPPLPVNLSRRELAARGQVPRALMLLFSMAEGTAKRLEDEQSDVWFVVELEDIETPELDTDDPLVASTQDELSSSFGDEYVAQFVTAAEDTIEIERNEDAIEALKAQLTNRSG